MIVGSELWSGALACALQNFGFSTMHVLPSTLQVERGIAWGPDVVLIDVRSFDVTAGSAVVAHLCGAGLRVCVIDAANGSGRSTTWPAGPAAIVDENESFGHLFRTILRVLRTGSPRQDGCRSASVLTAPPLEECGHSRIGLSAILTEREQAVLAELMEGHNAEEIAKAGYVSISTVRSQIKAIRRKLGVSSQLAAVATARRAGWTLASAAPDSDKPPGSRHRRIS